MSGHDKGFDLNALRSDYSLLQALAERRSYRFGLGGVANVNPAFMGPSLRVPMPKSATVGRIFQTLMPFLTTSRSKARLRMTTYRGKSSATMIYDQLPINDVFRKIDQDAVFGVMDLKGMKSPFFFILRREHGC